MLRALRRLLRTTSLRAAAAVPCLAGVVTDSPTVVEEPRPRGAAWRVVEYSIQVVRPDPSVVYHLQIVVPDLSCFRIHIVAPGDARPGARR
jgi:hypothetical protein